MYRGTNPGLGETTVPGDAIFDDVTLDGDDKMPWLAIPTDGLIDTTNTNQGDWIVSIGDSIPLLVRFPKDTAFYAGGPDSAVAERVYIGFGMEPDELNHFPLTRPAKQVYLAEILRLLAEPAQVAVFDKTYHYSVLFLTDTEEDTKDAYNIDFLKRQGFNTSDFWGYKPISEWGADSIAMLNAADLVIVGRSIGSGESEDSLDRWTFNELTTPVMF